MNETRATAPAYPPGRYGRRRDGKRRRAVPVTVLALVIFASVLVTVRLYRQWGDPDYDAQIVSWDVVSASELSMQFTVRVPAGGSTVCLLRGRDYGGNEVGRREVTLSASGDSKTIAAVETVPTKARAAVADVVSCQPPG